MAGQAEQTSKLGQNRKRLIKPAIAVQFLARAHGLGWARNPNSLTHSLSWPKQSIPHTSAKHSIPGQGPRITRRSHHVSRADGLNAAQGSERRSRCWKPGAGARVWAWRMDGCVSSCAAPPPIDGAGDDTAPLPRPN